MDTLFCSAWDPIPDRIQGSCLSAEELEAITAHARTLGEPEYLDQAPEIVPAAGKALASHLQRRLKVGYNRAARLVEEIERMGVVGPAQSSKPRDILHVPER